MDTIVDLVFCEAAAAGHVEKQRRESINTAYYDIHHLTRRSPPLCIAIGHGGVPATHVGQKRTNKGGRRAGWLLSNPGDSAQVGDETRVNCIHDTSSRRFVSSMAVARDATAFITQNSARFMFQFY